MFSKNLGDVCCDKNYVGLCYVHKLKNNFTVTVHACG